MQFPINGDSKRTLELPEEGMGAGRLTKFDETYDIWSFWILSCEGVHSFSGHPGGSDSCDLVKRQALGSAL